MAGVHRSARSLLAVAAVLVATVAGAPPAAATAGEPRLLRVAAGAAAGGDGSAGAPFADVAAALVAAGPGDVVEVGPGRYAGRLSTVRSGTAAMPIRILGRPGAHLVGDGTSRLLTIRHDNVVVEGLELSDANIAVVVTGATGVVLRRNWIHDTASECVRLRYQVTGALLEGNVVRGCGLARSSANGEGIYVGTAPEKRHENPGTGPDRSTGNVIRANDIAVWGECVDIKEDADANEVLDNVCTGGEYVQGAGLSSRARGTVFAGNSSTGNLGSGLQLAGDRPGDGADSVVVGNVLTGNGQYGLKVVPGTGPQRRLCGNVLTGNRRAATTPSAGGADAPC